MQIFHPLGTIECGLGGGVANALEHRHRFDRYLRAQQFGQQGALVKTALALPGRMQRHRDDEVEGAAAQPLVVQRGKQPACSEMAQVNLLVILKLKKDAAHNASTAVSCYGSIEIQRPLAAVCTGKACADRTAKWLGTSGAKRRHNPHQLRVTFGAEVLAGADIG